jgi:undecaprenyl-diphosphatase
MSSSTPTVTPDTRCRDPVRCTAEAGQGVTDAAAATMSPVKGASPREGGRTGVGDALCPCHRGPRGLVVTCRPQPTGAEPLRSLSEARSTLPRVPELAILTADYGLYVLAAAAGVVWLTLPRADKFRMAGVGLLAMALLAVLVNVAGAVWSDPRPFAVDGTTPLIPHPADNGFPSDHATAAAAAATVVAIWRIRTGIVLWLLAGAVAASRVAVHVHHVPDVLAGLVLGAAAALGGLAAHRVLTTWRSNRQPGPRDRHETDHTDPARTG